MFRLPKISQFNVNDQNDPNSSDLDSFDQNDGQPSFDSPDQFGTLLDATGWSPWFFRAETSPQSFLGWGASVAPFAGFGSGDSFSPSASAASASSRGGSPASGSSRGASAPVASMAGLSSPTSAASGASVTISTPGSGLVFVNTYESSCTAAFEACIVAAEEELESLFTNSVTLNVTFQEQSSPGSGDALTNNWSFVDVSYAALKAKLHSLDPLDVLPATDPNPAGGNDWALPEAYARMLGLSSSTPSMDDTVTLNTADTGLDDFGQDVINGVIHELSEGAMGRVGGLGDQNGVWSTMDLFRYTAAGAPDYTDGRDGLTTYFSSVGGSETSASGGLKGAPVLSFNNEFSGSTKVNGGDTADWVQEAVFGSVGGGETLTLDNTELQVMEALGWQLSLTQDVDDSVNNWETPTEWSTGSMPITPQDALIGGSGDATVWLNSNVTVNSISTTAGSTLTIGLNVVDLQEEASACTVIATDGTSLNSADASSVASGNLGTTYVEAGSAFQIGDPAVYPLDSTVTYDNAGSLVLGKGAGGVTDGVGVLYLDGTVTLNGAGTVTLGQSGNTGDILNASGTSGDELINVDNTISGSGFIDLGAFDNQADGEVEAQGFLQISAATFTNEGAMTAASGATLDLGQDGGTGSLTNTGSIAIDGGADLAISGNYTVSGTGYIGFKGAGGEITSDGSGPATFTNESTVYAVATDSATPTGQIGDQGILGSNDLTFDNSGSLIASGAGVTVTLNTGGNTINDGGGTLEAGSGATLVIDSNVDTGQVNSGSPPGGTIDAASGGTIILSATVADGVSGSSVPGQVVIDGGTFEMLAGSNVSVPVEFTTNGGTLELFSPKSLVKASGSNGTIDLTSAKVSIAGGNDTIVFVGGSGNVANLSDTAGSPDTVTGSSGSINLTNASISLSGSNDAITAGAGDTISLTSGTGDTFTGAGFTVDAAKGTGLTIGGDGLTGTTDTVSGSSMSVALEAGSHMTLEGSKDTVTISGVSNLTVAGSNDAIAAKKGDTITVNSGTGDTITGSGFAVHAKSAVSSFSLSGSNDAITAGAGDTISLTSGTGDTFTGAGFTVDATKGTGLAIGGDGLTGTTDTVSGSSVTVALEAGSHMTLKGSKDTAMISGVSNLSVAGSNDAIAAKKGDTITMNSGTGDTITGSDFTVHAKTAAFKIVGTSDVVYAGLNDTLTDGGSSTLFNIKGNVGALSIAGFGADATGVIDLLGGEGGYTTAGKAFAALTSDGSGGSRLSLGADGSIDLLGVARSSLHLTNFQIG
jgi:hypothetical protein